MRAVTDFLRELAGLFFDDGSLAFAVLGVLAATALLVRVAGVDGLPALALLVGGVIVALLENVVRTARMAHARR
jgi:hypothetical protein